MKQITILLFFILSLTKVEAQNFVPVDEGSAIKFTIKNFGFSTGGSFTGLTGTIRFDAANSINGSFAVSINASSINTDNKSRDKHLRKEEYFDVEKHPVINLVSSSISIVKPGTFLMKSKLTIKGITKEISFPFTAAAQNNGYLFSGSFKISRRDFGVGGASMVLADNLEVSLSVFAKKNWTLQVWHVYSFDKHIYSTYQFSRYKNLKAKVPKKYFAKEGDLLRRTSRNNILFSFPARIKIYITLKKCSGTRKTFPEFFGRAGFFLFKQAVKVGDIVKAATVRYFGYGVGSINQYPGGMAQPYFI